MLLYPEAQKKGQEELDAYLGSRLPIFEDLPHLPYVRAIMLEAIRSDIYPQLLLSPHFFLTRVTPTVDGNPCFR